MNLAIDIDGVLADFNTSFGKLLMKIQPELKIDIYSSAYPAVWDYPKHYGFSAETINAAWTEVKNSGLFWRSLFPYMTAHKDIWELSKARWVHDIYFVTTRPGKTAKAETEEWLRANGFENATVVICYDKPILCEAMKIDLIVDDKPENLWMEYGGCRRALFKRPYNKEHWSDTSLMLVDSVREALNAIS